MFQFVENPFKVPKFKFKSPKWFELKLWLDRSCCCIGNFWKTKDLSNTFYTETLFHVLL